MSDTQTKLPARRAPDSITASAPAKAMLFGEYAVLEGGPALAVALDRRIAATARRIDAPLLRVRSPIWPGPIDVSFDALEATWPPAPALNLLWPLLSAYAGAARRASRDGPEGGVEIVFDEGFPTRWGLGSSSASTLSALAALRTLAGAEAEAAALFAEARGAQRRQQGAASGYDVATQILGGIVEFQEHGGRTGFRTLADGGEIAEALLVCWTGRKVETGAMVREVRARFPMGSPIYSGIARLAEAAVPILRAADLDALGDAFRDGHRLLSQLGAVPSGVAAVVAALEGEPAVRGARLSGAGGGDCLLVLARDRAEAEAACQAHRLHTLPLRPTAQGLRWEATP